MSEECAPELIGGHRTGLSIAIAVGRSVVSGRASARGLRRERGCERRAVDCHVSQCRYALNPVARPLSLRVPNRPYLIPRYTKQCPSDGLQELMVSQSARFLWLPGYRGDCLLSLSY